MKYTNQISQISVSPVNISISPGDSQDVINNKLQGQINAGGGGGGSYPLDITAVCGEDFQIGDALVLVNGLWYKSRAAAGDTTLYMTFAIAYSQGFTSNQAIGRRRGTIYVSANTFLDADINKNVWLSATTYGAYSLNPNTTSNQYNNIIARVINNSQMYAICDEYNGYLISGDTNTTRGAVYSTTKIGNAISPASYNGLVAFNQLDLTIPASNIRSAIRLNELNITESSLNESAVDCATTANLTYPFTGLPIIDGYDLNNATSTYRRVLVKDQTTQWQNGIWIASNTTWAREYSASTWERLIGRSYLVRNGTQRGIIFTNTNNPGGTLGTSSIVYNDLSSYPQNPTINSMFISGPTQTASNSVVTLSQLQDFASGIQNKAAADWGTTTNITLSGTQTIDGGNPTNGQRILVKNQTTSSQNGIYIYNTSGTWTRATDMDVWSEVKGAQIRVLNGNTQSNTLWITVSIVDNGTIGTDSITWQQNSFSIADNSITDIKISTNAAINASKIANGTISNLEYQSLDGIDTSQTIQNQISSKQGLPNKLMVNSNVTLTSANLSINNPLVLEFNGNYTVNSISGSTFYPLPRANTSTTINGSNGDVYYLTMNSNTPNIIDITAVSTSTPTNTTLNFTSLVLTTAQNFPANANTLIQWTSLEYSVGNTMWNSSNPTLITIPDAGIYQIDYAMRTAGAYLYMAFSFNGNNSSQLSSSNTNGIGSISIKKYFNKGDTIAGLVFNNNTAAITASTTLNSCRMTIVQLSSQSIVTNGSYILGNGFSKLSANFTPTAGAVIPISGNQDTNNTIPISNNMVTLRAGRKYKLVGSMPLATTSANGAYFNYAWRAVGGSTDIGSVGVSISPTSTFNTSSCSAIANILVGSSDTTYELYVKTISNSPIIDLSLSSVEVDQLNSNIISPQIANYSYDEQGTGQYLTDSSITSQIYQKTFRISTSTTPSASTFFTTNGTTWAHGITNLYRVLDSSVGIIENSIYNTLPYISTTVSTSIYFNGTNIISRSNASWGSTTTAIITIFYTKTTG